jgi:hypothetical protein
MPLVAAGATLAPQTTVIARRGHREARELPWPGIHLKVLVPVIADGVKRIA